VRIVFVRRWCGTAFRLTGSSSHYTETVLYNFRGYWTQHPDGGFPVSLILSPDGTFYGSTQQGGSGNDGAVFALTPSVSGYAESVLYSFLGIGDGAFPNPGLIEDAAGNLFGTTITGGSTACNDVGCGTAFRLTTKPAYTESVLYDFDRRSLGYDPMSGLFAGRDGKLFGTTYDGLPTTASCTLCSLSRTLLAARTCSPVPGVPASRSAA
jgi:uncharacterized repeat protein (TIGR03803 family)